MPAHHVLAALNEAKSSSAAHVRSGSRPKARSSSAASLRRWAVLQPAQERMTPHSGCGAMGTKAVLRCICMPRNRSLRLGHTSQSSADRLIASFCTPMRQLEQLCVIRRQRSALVEPTC